MSERILELADKVYSENQFMMGLNSNIPDQFCLLFAEAIIRECADIILNNDIEKQEDYGFNHPFFGGWERGVIDSCQIIKKHFGVKE